MSLQDSKVTFGWAFCALAPSLPAAHPDELHQSQPAEQPRNGWILYDGDCGFCCWWVHIWKNTVERHGFAVKDLQSAAADGRVRIPQENLLDDVRVLTSSGELESGADAYLYVARKIWWAWPFFGLFILPGLNWILRRGYRWFNRNRYRLSRLCALPPQ